MRTSAKSFGASRLTTDGTKWRWLTAVLAALASSSVAVGAGCSAQPQTGEATAETRAPIFSAPNVDTTPQFAAVGSLSFPGGGCSGTLIAPDLVLTASHCFDDIARGCNGNGLPQASLVARKETQLGIGTPNQASFLISQSGLTGTGATTFLVDDVAINPAAYIDLSSCPFCNYSTNSNCTSCAAALFRNNGDANGLNLESDTAIAHLATAVPASLATPIQVITNISDSNPPPPSGSWVHFNLDQATDFSASSPVLPIIVGWGLDDFCTTARRSGQARFTPNSGNALTWDQDCEVSWSCQGPTTSTACNMNSTTGDHQITDMTIHRLLPVGAVLGAGDSGSPLIVAGGARGLNSIGGGFADISPTNIPFILGVASESTAPRTCGSPLVDGGVAAGFDSGVPIGEDNVMIYATTFVAINGTWIENTISDFDNDGRPNDSDNCPTVPNYDQHDTNFDAELEITLEGDCTDLQPIGCPPYEGQPPPPGSNQAYIAHWHANYPGDACDKNATTAAASTTVQDPEGRMAPCNICTVLGSNIEGCGVSNTQMCPAFLSSGISFSSYIGDSVGGAQTTTGTSAPSFCQCLGADTDPTWHNDCQAQKSAPSCQIANDSLFPTGTSNVSGSGWFPITKAGGVFHGTHLDTFPFPAMTTTHQEYSDVTTGYGGSYNPNLAVLATWDFPANLAEFGQPATATSLTGVRWGSVRTFSPSTGESKPQPNTPSNYVPVTVNLQGETIYRFFNPRYAPVSGIWELGGATPSDPGDPPWETIVDGLSNPIEQTIAGGAQVTGHAFDSAGLSLLAAVGAGTSDLLIGDDVVTGVPFQSALKAAIIVDHGTTNVLAAFTVTPIGRIATTTGGTGVFSADPPDLRSYDAADALLRSLHVDSTGASVTTVDVGAALAGTTSTATVAVSGAAPKAPLALAWNGVEASLYVVDLVPTGLKDAALRLLRIDRQYGSRELWRLEGARGLPDAVMLSMGQQNEHVLAIVVDGRSEVAAFDSLGSPRWSVSVAGELAAAPISTAGGASLALRRHGDTSHGLLKLKYVPHAAASNHLCGTHWLRHHVVTSPLSVLGDPSVDCGQERQDKDDGDH